MKLGKMNKIHAHSIILFFDLLSLLGLWYAYQEVQRVLIEVTRQAKIIEFGNRDFFLFIVLIIPVGHLLAIAEHYNANLIKIHNRLLNYCVIFALIILLAAGFFGSLWIKYRVENSGYTYCRNASGISALSRTIVYTKNMDVCEDLVETKRRRYK
jgi:hypothetical protein